MIPSTALGIVVFLAALGPGYVYVRVAERRSARPERSGLLEAVELIVIGAAASTAASATIAVVSAMGGILAINQALGHIDRYASVHGLKLIMLGVIDLILAYLLAYAWARLAHRHQPANIEPAGTSWLHAFLGGRPSEDHAVMVNIELRDGRRVTGALETFTIGLEDSREIGLVAPIAVRSDATATPATIGDTFMVVRESDILVLTGRYVAVSPAAPPRKPTGWREPVRRAGRFLSEI